MSVRLPPRLNLVHRPTPLWHHAALDRLVGCEVWVKRDDMTAGAAAGNKIRKLEFLLADAERQKATVVLTCGAAQSNHARATALLARQLGMQPHLFLRTEEPAQPPPSAGNLMLDRLVEARIDFITPEQYAQRNQLMEAAAEAWRTRGATPYVIAEGGSSGLGALGYVEAMREVHEQQLADPDLPQHFDSVIHACGSGGTAAGVALGSSAFGIAPRSDVIAVCDDASYFEGVIRTIIDEARHLAPGLPEPGPMTIHDSFKGPRYGEMDAAQQAFLRRVATSCGLVLDPVYSGKALFGLTNLASKPTRCLFIHTGGLPGLLAVPDLAP